MWYLSPILESVRLFSIATVLVTVETCCALITLVLLVERLLLGSPHDFFGDLETRGLMLGIFCSGDTVLVTISLYECGGALDTMKTL